MCCISFVKCVRVRVRTCVCMCPLACMGLCVCVYIRVHVHFGLHRPVCVCARMCIHMCALARAGALVVLLPVPLPGHSPSTALMGPFVFLCVTLPPLCFGVDFYLAYSWYTVRGDILRGLQQSTGNSGNGHGVTLGWGGSTTERAHLM